MSTSEKSPLSAVWGLLGAAGGWALSQYCGPALWIPGLATLILIITFKKSPIHPNQFVAAIAVTGAHIVWFIFGSAITGQWSATIIDIIVLLAGITWLWIRPGIAPALFLGIIQIFSLAINILLLSSAPIGTQIHKALTAHCVFRILSIIFLIVGYLKLRKERLNSPFTSSSAEQGAAANP
jgi:hypothetical protein